MVPAFVQQNLRTFEQCEGTQEAWLVRCPDEAEVRFNLGARQVVVNEGGSRSVDGDVEPDSCEKRVPYFCQIPIAPRGYPCQQSGVEIDVVRQARLLN